MKLIITKIDSVKTHNDTHIITDDKGRETHVTVNPKCMPYFEACTYNQTADLKYMVVEDNVVTMVRLSTRIDTTKKRKVNKLSQKDIDALKAAKVETAEMDEAYDHNELVYADIKGMIATKAKAQVEVNKVQQATFDMLAELDKVVDGIDDEFIAE